MRQTGIPIGGFVLQRVVHAGLKEATLLGYDAVNMATAERLPLIRKEAPSGWGRLGGSHTNRSDYGLETMYVNEEASLQVAEWVRKALAEKVPVIIIDEAGPALLQTAGSSKERNQVWKELLMDLLEAPPSLLVIGFWRRSAQIPLLRDIRKVAESKGQRGEIEVITIDVDTVGQRGRPFVELERILADLH